MVGAALFETRRLSQRCSGSGRCGPRFSGGAFLSAADASAGGAAEVSFQKPDHQPRLSRPGRAHRFKTCSQHGIPGIILRRRLLSASALPAPSEPASAMNLCRCQTTWVSQSSPRPRRARARLSQPTRRARRPSRRTAGDSKRAQAPTRPKARDPPGNWLFLEGDEPASRSNKRPVLK